MKITIVNWQKYNPRKDIKNSGWLRLENTLFTDPELFDLSLEEMGFWVYLLCICASNNKETITISESHFTSVARGSKSIFYSGLNKLILKGKIKSRNVDVTYAERIRTLDIDSTGPTYVRTDDTRRTKRNETKRNERNENTCDELFENSNPENIAPDSTSQSRPNKTFLAFSFYSEAYKNKYGIDPIKSPRVMGQLKQLVSRIPSEEIGNLINHYLDHSDPFYKHKGHPVGLLLMDCEKLRTEMLTGVKLSRPTAADFKSASNHDRIMQLKREIEEDEKREREVKNENE